MNREQRCAAIEMAEKAVGSKLPKKLRAKLEETGEAWFVQPSDNIGADPVFCLAIEPKDGALFGDQQRQAITELGGWDEDCCEAGWDLQTNAFLAIDNQCGDTVLLSPDKAGVARRFVFCNHETGEFQVWNEDVETMLA